MGGLLSRQRNVVMLKPSNLSPTSPRLSTAPNTKPFRGRKICQRCDSRTEVAAWIEHDHNDQPEPIYVFLCKVCSDALIGPHMRLYRIASENEGLPGIMDICADCPWREGSRCKCPIAKFNGGTGDGLKYSGHEVSRMFVDGTKFRGMLLHWFKAPTGCSGKTIDTN